MRRKQVLMRNLENLYSLLWGQCEKPLQEKLRSLAQYDELASKCDALALLLSIREVAFNQQSQRYQPLQVLEMNKGCYGHNKKDTKQQPPTSNSLGIR